MFLLLDVVDKILDFIDSEDLGERVFLGIDDQVLAINGEFGLHLVNPWNLVKHIALEHSNGSEVFFSSNDSNGAPFDAISEDILELLRLGRNIFLPVVGCHVVTVSSFTRWDNRIHDLNEVGGIIWEER